MHNNINNNNINFRLKQRGVIRTNCLDCIDRTGAIQMEIAQFNIKEMFLFYIEEAKKYKDEIYNYLSKF